MSDRELRAELERVQAELATARGENEALAGQLHQERAALQAKLAAAVVKRNALTDQVVSLTNRRNQLREQLADTTAKVRSYQVPARVQFQHRDPHWTDYEEDTTRNAGAQVGAVARFFEALLELFS